MARVKVVRDGMPLDLVVWNELGRQDGQLVEQTLARNPGIASAGTILPVGTIVDLPEPPAARARLRETVKLWS